MVVEQFCPKCGTTKCVFIKGFCQNCFLEDNKIIVLPQKIPVEHCKKCGKIRVKGKWLEQSEQNIKRIVESALKLKQISLPVVSIELKPLEDGTTIASVAVEGKIGGEKILLETESLLVQKEITCNDCTLLGANYYEAVLQLRFGEKKSEEEMQKTIIELDSLARALEKKDSLAKITSIQKAHGGFDALVGSKRAAKKIVEHFEKRHKAQTKSSFTLAGVNSSGKVKKRFTFLIKM